MSNICTYESGLQRGTRFLEWIICLPAWSTVLVLLKAMYLLIPGYSPFCISCFAFFAFLSVQCADRKNKPNIFKVIDSTGETTGACVSIIQFAKFFWYFIGQQVDRQQIFNFRLIYLKVDHRRWFLHHIRLFWLLLFDFVCLTDSLDELPQTGGSHSLLSKMMDYVLLIWFV